jgi:hypothetical protein
MGDGRSKPHIFNYDLTLCTVQPKSTTAPRYASKSEIRQILSFVTRVIELNGENECPHGGHYTKRRLLENDVVYSETFRIIMPV